MLAPYVLAAFAALGGFWGCGTDPVNPDGCRAIEDARCEAAASCPAFQGIDVNACKRFYRDQCLHGLSVATDPGDPQIDRCVRAINLAAKCARTQTSPCNLGKTDVPSACDFIAAPETAWECEFIMPAVEEPETGTDAATETSTEDTSTTEQALESSTDQPDASVEDVSQSVDTGTDQPDGSPDASE